MLTPPADAVAMLRLAATRGGAVARVGALTQTERARPVDPARTTDPRWSDGLGEIERLRPDAARIPIGDVTQFQALVYGPTGRSGAASAVPHSLGHAPGAAAALSAEIPTFSPSFPGPHAPPADRIAHTLQHLRGLRGL